jgi:hypothetical protein
MGMGEVPGNNKESVLYVHHRLLDSEKPLYHRSAATPSAAAVPPLAAAAFFPRQRYIRLHRRPARPSIVSRYGPHSVVPPARPHHSTNAH